MDQGVAFWTQLCLFWTPLHWTNTSSTTVKLMIEHWCVSSVSIVQTLLWLTRRAVWVQVECRSRLWSRLMWSGRIINRPEMRHKVSPCWFDYALAVDEAPLVWCLLGPGLLCWAILHTTCVQLFQRNTSIPCLVPSGWSTRVPCSWRITISPPPLINQWWSTFGQVKRSERSNIWTSWAFEHLNIWTFDQAIRSVLGTFSGEL